MSYTIEDSIRWHAGNAGYTLTRVTMRLDPEAMEVLRHYAKAWGCPMSEVVEVALNSLQNDKTANWVQDIVTKTRKAART